MWVGLYACSCENVYIPISLLIEAGGGCTCCDCTFLTGLSGSDVVPSSNAVRNDYGAKSIVMSFFAMLENLFAYMSTIVLDRASETKRDCTLKADICRRGGWVWLMSCVAEWEMNPRSRWRLWICNRHLIRMKCAELSQMCHIHCDTNYTHCIWESRANVSQYRVH